MYDLSKMVKAVRESGYDDGMRRQRFARISY